MQKPYIRTLATVGASVMSAGLIMSAASAATAPSAATNNTGQALEISPPLLTLTADPGQTLTTQINLRDVSSGKLVVSSQVNDFVAAGEDGTPKILLDNNTDDPFSMKTWVAPLAPLTLSPQQIQKLSVTIHVPATASPGGHYGVVRFTAAPPDLNGQGVSLSASLGSLMLVTVRGKTTDKLSVAEFSVAKESKNSQGDTVTTKGTLFQSTPLQFIERIKNDGNIHEEPIGQVTITNMFGKTVAGVNVNMPPRNILPASIRKFQQPLDSSVIGNKKFFGHYTAKLKLTYGASQQVVAASIGFWVIPYKLIIIIVVALVVGFFLLRFIIKRYNRYIIKKVQSANKK